MAELESLIKIEPEKFDGIEIRDIERVKNEISKIRTPRKQQLKIKMKAFGVSDKQAKKKRSRNTGNYTSLSDPSLAKIAITSCRYRAAASIPLHYDLPYSCDLCGRENLKSRLAIQTHMNAHMAAPTFRCDLCPRTFSHINRVKRHMAVHIQGYYCIDCPYSSPYKFSLIRHRYKHDGAPVCPICKKRYVDIVRHIKVMHYEKDKVFGKIPCEICGKMIVKLNMKLHLKNSHVPKVPCPSCNEKFIHKYSLNQHMLKTHYEGKLIGCYQCDDVFKNKSMLSHHKEVHQNISCEYCGKKLRFKSSVRHHVKVCQKKKLFDARMNI